MPAPRQIFSNFGFMSVLATVGTEKRPDKRPDGGGEKEMIYFSASSFSPAGGGRHGNGAGGPAGRATVPAATMTTRGAPTLAPQWSVGLQTPLVSTLLFPAGGTAPSFHSVDNRVCPQARARWR